MFSQWVDSCKRSMLKSAEWRHLSERLHSTLSEQLQQDNVGFFGDLKEEEQFAYIRQIKHYDLKHVQIYNEFLHKLRESMEQHIRGAIADLEQQQQQNDDSETKDDALHNLSRLDKILYLTAEGTAQLLGGLHPNVIREQLSGLIHTSLSPNLRKAIWNLLLSNQASDSDHMQQQQQTSTLATNNFRITEECETVLFSLAQTLEIPHINTAKHEPGFGDIHTLLPIMKAVMACYHQDIGFFQTENAALCDRRFFYLVVPILVCVSDFMIGSVVSRTDMYTAYQSQAYEWFMQCIRNDSKEDTQSVSYDIFFDRVRFGSASYLRHYQEVEQLIVNKAPNLYSTLKQIAVAAEIINDASTNQSWIRSIIEPVIEILIENWFVTVVNIEMCLHIWDKLMLNTAQCLSPIIVALLVSSLPYYKPCATLPAFTKMCKRVFPTLHYSELSKKMKALLFDAPQFKSIEHDSNNYDQALDRGLCEYGVDLKPDQVSREQKDTWQKMQFHSVHDVEEQKSPEVEPVPIIQRSILNVSVNNKKLFAMMILVGKLQRMSESVVMDMINPTTDFTKELMGAPLQNEISEETDKKVVLAPKPELPEPISKHKLRNMMLEECAMQVLRGLKEISLLKTEK